MTKLERIRGCAGVTDTAGYTLYWYSYHIVNTNHLVWPQQAQSILTPPSASEDEPSSVQVNGTVLLAFADSLQGRAVD